MKTAIVTDSNSGFSPTEAQKYGIYVLNMPVLIAGREYLENVDILKDDFYAALAQGENMSTSQPSTYSIISLWNQALSFYDEVLYIPMSSGLSGSCESAIMLSYNYNGRVTVVDNQRISVTQRQSVLDAKVMADAGRSATEIKKILEDTRFDSRVYIMVNTLEYLKKGGRITAAGAAMAGVLNIKPVLQIRGEKLDAFRKCRGIKQGKRILQKALISDIGTEIGPINPDTPNAWIGIAYTHNPEEAYQLKHEIQALLPNYPIIMDELPLSIAVHIGPGALAVTWTKILPQGCHPK